MVTFSPALSFFRDHVTKFSFPSMGFQPYSTAVLAMAAAGRLDRTAFSPASLLEP